MKYTTEQKLVMNFKKGNLQIIACAGSGKTTSISKRIANLIGDGITAKNIVAFTFTEKAADVMKYKVRKYVSELPNPPGDLGEMYIGTIHAFCFDILKKFNPEFQGFDVLDDNQRMIFLKKNYKALGLDNPDIRHKTWYTNNHSWVTISNLMKNIDIVREERLKKRNISNKDFIEILEKYDELLNKRKFLDFSSIMSHAVETLEGDFEILQEVRNRVRYLIVDEYQDVNPIQERLIELISTKVNVCVVGDDDQAIYGWRGTKVKNILTFSKRYSKVTQIPLVKNFRSTPGLLKHANSLIQEMAEHKRLPKEMRWGNEDRKYEEGDIYSSYFVKQSEEIDWVINKIKTLHGTEFKEDDKIRALDYRDFALIFRSVARHAKPFINKLREEGIPYIVKGSIGLFERDEIQLIIQVLAFILEPQYEVSYNLEDADAKRRFSNLYGGNGPNYEDFLRKIITIKEKIAKNRFVNLQKTFQQVLNALGLAVHKVREDILYNLGQMSMVISDYEGQYFPVRKNPYNLGDFFEFLMEHAAFSYEEGGHDEKYGGVNAIQILTMHRSKGLEFPVVFLSSLIKNAFPKYRRDETKWFIDEGLIDKRAYATTEDSQRRLIYVAMTRSMKYLFLTYSMRMPDYQRQQLPTEFIGDMADDMILRKPVPDPTQRKKSNEFIPPPNEVFPTNFSELGFYYDCPYDFKLRQVFGFNPVLDPMLGYGKSVHNILNILHKNMQRGKKFDIDRIINKNFQLRFAKKEDEEISKKKAAKVIKNYFQHYRDDVELSLETEKPFEIVIGNALISGQIDLIRKQTPKGEEITIVEYKTELDPDEFRKTKHEDQVTLYGIAYQNAFKKKPEKLYVHYLEESNGKRVEITLNNNTSSNVIDKIDKAVSHIKCNNFPRKPYTSSRCKKCNFKLICRGTK